MVFVSSQGQLSVTLDLTYKVGQMITMASQELWLWFVDSHDSVSPDRAVWGIVGPGTVERTHSLASYPSLIPLHTQS